MKNNYKTSIVLYGTIIADNEKWWDWYQYAKNSTKTIGYSPNYVGIIGDSFKSGKILTINRTEKKLRSSIENKDVLESISVYSLPSGYVQAAFDFDTFMCMDKSSESDLITISVPSENFDMLDINKVLSDLSEYISYSNGEIFEMSVLECPFFYASKVNSAADFESLNIIDQF